MACLPGEPDALLGFVASESKDGDLPCVHMVYVAPFYRGMGVASSLLAAAVPDLRFHYSFRTAGADRFRRPKYQVAFAPERARRIK